MSEMEGLLPPELRVLGKLGQGSFGSVYKAQHSSGEVYSAAGARLLRWCCAQIVAVKGILMEGEAESQTLQELQREIAILQRHSPCLPPPGPLMPCRCDHPNIVRYHGSTQHGSHLWIVMEICAGGSVADLAEVRTICTTALIASALRGTGDGPHVSRI